MRIFIFILLLLCVSPVWAEDAKQESAPAIEVPELGFGKKVEIVVAAKQNPNILDFKINQDKADILCDLIINKDLSQDEVKTIALNVIMIAKSMSLDDAPKEKDKPGKGLYNYKLSATSPNGVLILKAMKPKEKENLSFEFQFPPPQPLTRADAAGR